MKIRKIFSTLLAIIILLLSFSGCGKKETKTVLFENESTGELMVETNEYFNDFNKSYCNTQLDALIQLYANNGDMAVVDYITAINYVGEDKDFPLLAIDGNIPFSKEEYAVAFRKGSDTVNYVNKAITEMVVDGSLKQIAEKYNLNDILLNKTSFDNIESGDTESDWKYIKDKETLVVGITLFAPMNYYDDNGTLVGFDTEFAKAIADKLGLKVEFKVITREDKEDLLNNKSIDCVWNAVTVTDDRQENMEFSMSYMEGKQVAVINTKPVKETNV